MRPQVSVIIATYNSGKLLTRVLNALKKQNFPKKRIEKIVIDGGSTDDTLDIAKKFKCRVIKNPRTEPVYAKYLGFNAARGSYLMYLDHDEVIKNPNSISIKVQALADNKNAKSVAGGNYVNPKGYNFINNYINEFGDPFSFFMYRISKRNKLFFATMAKRYQKIYEVNDYAVFNLEKTKDLPLIELVAGASMFEKLAILKIAKDRKIKFDDVAHLFYLLFKRYKHVIVLRNDPILHYSSDTLRKYLRKITWRVKNNIYFRKYIGTTGYSGRQLYYNVWFNCKKYLFIPYALLIVPVFIDSILLVWSRKDLSYLYHIPLTIYTAIIILKHGVFKYLGAKPGFENYDGTKKLKRLL